jgi:hypothetical protein
VVFYLNLVISLKGFRMSILLLLALALVFTGFSAEAQIPAPSSIFDVSGMFRAPAGMSTRWSSFENPTAGVGSGGKENSGAKGHAFESLKAGETKTLLDIKGCGTVTRIWMTLNPREPKNLRAVRLQMYWDGADKPAVCVPLGDFFGAVLGRLTQFENELFCAPEGRSFNVCIPMPFRTAARITVTNDGSLDFDHIFYDVNVLMQDQPHDPDTMYFHATWRRERQTTLGKDFEILPKVAGRGRFVGTHIGVIANREYAGWWGEGEVKMFVDGDTEFPTLCGTGTEDYIGTGWGQGVFHNRYQGSLVSDAERAQYTFYRYHIPDPVFFQSGLRVTLQQIGGADKTAVLDMLRKGLALKPVSIDRGGRDKFTQLQDGVTPSNIEQDPIPGGWTNYYRQDDVSAVAFFYLDKPMNGLPDIAPCATRTEAILDKNPAAIRPGL